MPVMKLLTATSVAKDVGMSPRTVKRWCADEKIEATRLDGPQGIWLITPKGAEQAQHLADLARQFAAAHVKTERGAA